MQKKSTLVVAVVLMMLITGTMAFKHTSAPPKPYSPMSSGIPPAGFTGATGNYCSNAGCHSSFALNSGGGSITTSSGLPSVYAAGTKYNFSITISHGAANRVRWGFSIIAVNAIGQAVGTFSSTNANAAANGSELSHLAAVTTGVSGSYTYTNLAWTAPASPGTNDNTITFYYAGVAGDNANSSLQDYVYASTKSCERNIPQISSFAPTSAGSGITVTISGTHFTGASSVKFGGTSATSFSVINDNSINAVVGSGTSGGISVTTPGGTATKTGFTYIVAPSITSFSPTSAASGDNVSITGTNFTGATAVKFGGTAASSFTVNSSTSISAVVGSGSSGSVSVTTPGGTATKSGFTYLSTLVPTITSFTPTSAASGDNVSITGTNFTGATAVSFGGTAASSFIVNSSTSISAVVGSGSSGSVSVTTPGGTATKTGFTYISTLVPTITSFSPTSAASGDNVSITGTNFTGATAVSFGGTAASSFIVNSSTSISAVVGSGSSGSVSVTTPGGTATKSGFTYISSQQSPVITGIKPRDGPPGTVVTVEGSGFNPVASNNIIYFGAVKGTVNAAISTSMTANVPTGTSFNLVSITTGNLTAYSTKPFILTFAGGGTAFTKKSFAARVGINTMLSPRNVPLYDIDGDGKPDLIVINNASNSVSIFRNTGSSGTVSFAAGIDFPTDDLPNSVAVADFDGDGKLDLAVTNEASGTVSVYKSKSKPGNIAFAARISYPTGTNPQSVVVNDMDGDGKPDIIECNSKSNTVSIFRNTSAAGIISFKAKVDFITGEWPRAVAVSNLDGDKKVDMVVANRNEATISVYRNISSGANILFETKQDYATGTYPVGIVLADFDGGTPIDIAVTNKQSNSISVFRNTSTVGAITLAPKQDFATDIYPIGITSGDMDGDGNVDIGVANLTSNTISLLRNNSTAGIISFEPKVSYATGNSPWNLSTGDADMDGKADMIVSNSDDNTVSILRNKTKAALQFAYNDAVNDNLKASAGKEFTATLSPNPANNFVMLTVINAGDDLQFIVTDVKGKIVRKDKISETKTSIPLAGLANGVYVVTVSNKTFSKTLRFVKE